jgi:hypothetical protein
VTEHQHTPEDPASESASGDAESALPATEVNVPGPGEVPPDTEVNPAEPEAAPTVADSPAPMPESDTAPTVIAPAPTAAVEDAPEPVPASEPARAPEPAPGTKPATPPPEPPPPEPPPIALDSGHRTSTVNRPEIPVAAAFVGGFVLAMILRRLAR